MSNILLSLLLLSCLGTSGEDFSIEASSLRRKDLPDDFPFQTLDVGFAVLRITIRNGSDRTWKVPVGEISVYDAKGKRIEQALPTDITPKLMKFYTGTSKGVSGEGYYGSGGRPMSPQMGRVPTIDRSSKQPVVSMGTAQALRATLEHYEIKPFEIGPGETIEAFYYLKSKKSGMKLSGGRLNLADWTAGF